MKHSPSPVAIVLELTRRRVLRILECRDYNTAMSQVILLDQLLAEFQEAEQAAAK